MGLQITPSYIDLEYAAPDASYKKIVRLATTADLGASTYVGSVLTGYSQTVSALSATSTAASITLTVSSTAAVKSAAQISVASTFVPAGLTVTIASATTLTLSAATRVMTTTAAAGTGVDATLTFAAQTYAPYAVGASIVVAGVTPTGFNGTFTVTACTTTTVTYANATVGPQTVAGTITQTVSAGTANLSFVNTIAALTIDGVATAVNDRILVKDQRTLGNVTDTTAAKGNGIYRVTAIGSSSVPWVLTRTQDADSSTDLDSAIVNVSVGTANFGKTYKTRFPGTGTLNSTEMYWGRVVDVNSSALAALPTTATGVHISTDTETTLFKAGAVTDLAMNSLGITTVQAVSASTYTRASTLYIAGAPVASTNVTINTPYSLYVAGGNGYIGGNVTAVSFTASGSYITGAANTNGYGFWAGGPNIYGILMSSAADVTYGGRIAGETTSDYNMYFSMQQGTNRGFVFRNAYATPLFAINGNGVRSNVGVTITGALTATTKSFLIDHPTKEGMQLQYGSLESPYHGVRLTGEGIMSGTNCLIELPDYIKGLCKQEGAQVQITNIRHDNIIWVEDIIVDENYFTVATANNAGNEYRFYWSFTAVRKDITDLEVELS